MMNQKQIKPGRYRCRDCGSSRGLAYYEDATHCFSCGAHTLYSDTDGPPPARSPQYIQEAILTLTDTTKLRTMPIRERGIAESTVEKYGVGILLDEETGQPKEHHYPIFARGRNPERLGSFIRALPKQFRHEPAGQGLPQKAALFGQNVFDPGYAKFLTVTEGHLDALATYQMFGGKFPVVSVVNGADSAPMDFKRNLEYLESFERVYICFDRDPAGQKAAIACAKLLTPGKAYIVALDPKLKDASNYLKEGKIKEFVDTWWKGSPYTPQNILASSQLKERLRNRTVQPSVPYPFEGLNKLTYGIRKKEAVIVTAPTGVGKTSFLRETMWNILQEDKEAKIGTMFLEEDPNDSGLGLMSMAASIPFHLPDAKYTQEDYDEAEKVLDEDRVFFFDHFGSNSIDDILNRVRFYAKGLGCDYIIIDHLSIIVSDQQQGDERKALDEIMTKLKTLTMELDIALLAVVHTNRNGQIRGTAGIEQLANIVINLERDLTAEDPAVRRTLMGVVSKNRFSGKTGPAFAVMYNEQSGRLEEPDDEARQLAASEELTKFFKTGSIESKEDVQT